MRTLTGKLQQLQNQVDTQNAQLNKQLGDLTFQMQNGGAGCGGRRRRRRGRSRRSMLARGARRSHGRPGCGGDAGRR